jgi:3,5-epimerase/4-reductase
MSEILVFGKGWVGKRIADYLQCNSSDARINTYEDVQAEIDKYKPKVIINCLGHFGKNVDDCEINKTKTLSSHTFVPLLLVEGCIRNNIKFVHLSSGCIFHYDYEKNKPLTEMDSPDFYNLYYSRTKIYTEAALYALKDSCNILQLRLRMPLDFIPHKRNLLDKLIEFKSVIDIPNSVTYLPDFLDGMRHLIKTDATGIYNMVNYGGLRFRELLEIYRQYRPNHSYAIADVKELKIVRTNLILSTDKLEESGFQVRDIHDVLVECVEKWMAIAKANNAGQA